METRNEDEKDHQPTFLGCLLMLLSVGVIFGLAVPVVMWRDAETHEPLPRMVAIMVPIIAGALFYGAGSAIFRFFGLSVMKRKKDASGTAEDDQGSPGEQERPD